MNGTDISVLENRMAATKALLEENGFEALLVYARGSSAAFGSKSHGYMRYLRDWDTYHTPGVLILVPGANRVLLTSDIFLYTMMREQALPGEETLFAPLPELGAAAARALLSLTAKTGRALRALAYTGRSETPVPFWETLKNGLGPDIAIHGFEDHLDPALAVKDAAQLTLHRQAAAICDAMYEELDRLVPTGLSVWHLRAAMEKTARDAGAEHSLIWLTAAPKAESCHFYREDSTRVPQPGDQILCGIYTLYRGHWGHGIRMGCYGEGTPAMRRGYDMVLEMQEAGLAALRPGQDLYAVNDAMERVFARYFPGTRHTAARENTPEDNPENAPQDVFRFRAAHGLGHFSEDPLTTDPFQHGYLPHVPPSGAVLPVREGMLLELHPNCFPAGAEGAALGDMVHVGAERPELLLAFPREFRNWGA